MMKKGKSKIKSHRFGSLEKDIGCIQAFYLSIFIHRLTCAVNIWVGRESCLSKIQYNFITSKEIMMFLLHIVDDVKNN